MKINDPAIYIDIKGVEHNALVAGFDARVEGVIDLVYLDAKGDVQKMFAVHHVSSDAKQEVRTVKDSSGNDVVEGNIGLPSYPLNAYKLPGEDHNAIPSDHPIHDHPFEPKQFDSDGKMIPKSRPETEAAVAAHVAAMPKEEAVAAE